MPDPNDRDMDLNLWTCPRCNRVQSLGTDEGAPHGSGEHQRAPMKVLEAAL